MTRTFGDTVPHIMAIAVGRACHIPVGYGLTLKFVNLRLHTSNH